MSDMSGSGEVVGIALVGYRDITSSKISHKLKTLGWFIIVIKLNCCSNTRPRIAILSRPQLDW
jgi:hypothetical protein